MTINKSKALLITDMPLDEMAEIVFKHRYDYHAREVYGGYRDPGHWWQIEDQHGRVVGERIADTFDAHARSARLCLRSGIADLIARIRK